MKQRIRIKQYKKALNKSIDLTIESFEYDVKHFHIKDTTTAKIYHEYFQDLENLGRILKNKQLHTIKKLFSEYPLFNNFSYLLDNIDAVFECAFDDKEVYNYSNLLRKPISKPLKQKKRKQYEKAFNCLFSFYKKRIKAIQNTLAYINLVMDLNIINSLIQQNRIKELNNIIKEDFKGYLDNLISWYLYEFDDKYNTIIYDYELRKIKL